MEKGLKKMKERKKGSTSSIPWTPFTPQPLHDFLLEVVPSYVKRVHMEPSQLVDKEARVEKVWIFNLFSMEAL